VVAAKETSFQILASIIQEKGATTEGEEV